MNFHGQQNCVSKLTVKNLSNAYPMLMESPITRQFIFPVVAFNGGPGLHIRSAGITDQLSALLITGLTEVITNTYKMKDKKKAIVRSCGRGILPNRILNKSPERAR